MRLARDFADSREANPAFFLHAAGRRFSVARGQTAGRNHGEAGPPRLRGATAHEYRMNTNTFHYMRLKHNLPRADRSDLRLHTFGQSSR
jgi:hypothetical protein